MWKIFACWIVVSLIFYSCSDDASVTTTTDTTTNHNNTVAYPGKIEKSSGVDTLFYRANTNTYIDLINDSSIKITVDRSVRQQIPIDTQDAIIYYARTSDSTGWLFNNKEKEMVYAKRTNNTINIEEESWIRLKTERDSLQRISSSLTDSTYRQKTLNNRKLSSLPRSAILGYSFFRQMKQKETRSIYAYVTINDPESLVLEMLDSLNRQHLPVRDSDTASVFTQNILLYKYLDVSLIDPDNDFTIIQVHNSGRQLIDTIDGNLWQWSITPKTSKKLTHLILRVIAEKQDGSKDHFQSRNIPIDIRLEFGFFRRIWTWLMDNPESFLVLIIIPIATYFIRRLLGNEKK